MIEVKKQVPTASTGRATALVFCCGGGLTTGALKDEGYEVLGGIDNWDFAEHIYKKNFPNCKFLNMSLRALTPTRICEEFGIVPGEIDLIQISNPCTGASSLSEGEPMAAVNDLFFVCTALAFALNPKVVLFENVKNLTRSDMALLFGMFWFFLQRAGVNYNHSAIILNSWLFGDAQARERIFIQCVRKDVGHPVWPNSIPLDQRKYIRDVIPEAEYVVNRSYGKRMYHYYQPAPTIVGHPDLSYYDGEQDHKVNPRQYARFMGVPEWYILEGAVADQLLVLGNGVPWNVMRKLAAVIRDHILGYPPPNDTEPAPVMPLLPPPINRPLEKGFVVYEGPSQLDGEEIVAILTLSSNNPKTGDMAQLWILRSDMSPLEAVKKGVDLSICGDCALRPSKEGICYVNVGKAPTSVWRAWKNGLYPNISEDKYKQAEGKAIRFGAYGDPKSLPIKVLEDLKQQSDNHTCYTHYWKDAPEELQSISMASVESEDQYREAAAAGWRTFRIISEGDPLMEDEIICPNVSAGVQCRDCRLCSGTSTQAKNIAIPVHGKGKKNFTNRAAH